MNTVACPCCHGKRFLLQEVDQFYPDNPPCRYTCMHCEGNGKVPHGPVSEDKRQARMRRLKPVKQRKKFKRRRRRVA